MTGAEARATNLLLKAIGVPDPHRNLHGDLRPTREEAIEAAAYLAGRAHKALYAGLDRADVERGAVNVAFPSYGLRKGARHA